MTDFVGSMVLRMFAWLEAFSAWTRRSKATLERRRTV
jgi:hypothetical protein